MQGVLVSIATYEKTDEIQFHRVAEGAEWIRPAAPSDIAENGFLTTAGGRMWIDQASREELEATGLADFEAVMATLDGDCLRVLEDRQNWRLEIAGRGAFLKKHRIRTWTTRLAARLGRRPQDSAGRVEARYARRLAADRIGVMNVLAWGERLDADGRLESFFLSEELDGFLPLDDFIRRRFSPLGAPARLDGDLARLVRQVAAVARRFHRAGYNHRDFYCCHLFVRETGAGRFDIRLIDLQRVQHRTWRRERWLVKDLAQLAWSAPRSRVTCSRRMAFIKHYLGVRRLAPGDKRFVRKILARQRRMERRLGKCA